MPIVHCYRKENVRYIVAPLTFNEVGWGQTKPPFDFLNGDASDEQVGATIRAALARCGKAPLDSTLKDPVYSASGEKSKVQFIAKWHSVHVQFGHSIQIMPSTRYKKRFQFLVDETIHLPADTDDRTLGEAVKRAFGLCRNGPRDFMPNGKPIG
ncbi:MAG: immunity protein [Symbiobacteriaceae bacterium]|jgi:hypothetical protein|nr:immunity protein [Symbiobacteriaceae bacterium]